MNRASLLTYQQLSDATGVVVGTLKRWKHEGMPAHSLPANGVRFDLAEAKAWIAARRADPTPLRRLRPCTFDRVAVVYFGFTPDGDVKIGWTSYTRERQRKLGFEIVAVVPGDKRIEASFHRFFADEHIEGELFRASERLTSFVYGLADLQTTKKPRRVA